MTATEWLIVIGCMIVVCGNAVMMIQALENSSLYAGRSRLYRGTWAVVHTFAIIGTFVFMFKHVR